jgi:thymidine phosphorylase
MIFLGGKASSIQEGIEISKELIENGKAFNKFLEIVKLQGGDVEIIKHPEKYPKSKIHEYVIAGKPGYLQAIDNFEIGMASLELGAGRMTIEDKIDPKAGIIFNPKIGDKIKKGAVMAEIFTDKKEKVEIVKKKIMAAITIGTKKPGDIKLIKSIIL